MQWETLIMPSAALLVSVTTFIYTTRKKRAETYAQQLERRLEDIEQKELRCTERLEAMERQNHDLLLRLAGIKPTGRPLRPDE